MSLTFNPFARLGFNLRSVSSVFGRKGVVVASPTDYGAGITMNNDTYIEGRNAADNADVNILKLNASDVPEFGVIPITPSAAPTTNYQVANKKYVDDNKGDALSADTTVNFTSSMTATEIQALIDAQPKNLGGYALNYQFADGNYTLDSSLTFSYFHSGALYVNGKLTDSTLSTTKAVFLDFTGTTTGISIANVECAYTVQSFKIQVVSNPAVVGIFPQKNSGPGTLSNNYILGNGTASGYAIYLQQSNIIHVYNNYISNINIAINTTIVRVYSANNDDTGTTPLYGLKASQASTIGKTGTQPDGSTSTETASDGGVIR